jgi:hypothetical protein
MIGDASGLGSSLGIVTLRYRPLANDTHEIRGSILYLSLRPLKACRMAFPVALAFSGGCGPRSAANSIMPSSTVARSGSGVPYVGCATIHSKPSGLMRKRQG